MSGKEDRLLNDKPFRHYRRTYSLAEVRWSVVVLVSLGVILGWVVWKGQHPDPELFAEAPGQVRRGDDLGGQQVAPTGRAGAGMVQVGGAPPAADRGPLPEGLAPTGWKEKGLTTFGPDNVYEKINGREGYYKSFGFQKLYFLTLESERDDTVLIDLEVYDLGEPSNALGAFAGETPQEVTPEMLQDGLMRFDRNAAFVTRGELYVRAVAAEETEEIRAALEHVLRRFRDEVKGADLPWSYALFVAGLGVDAGRVSFVPENAFSFAFAKGVHKASMGEDLEVFVMPSADLAAAKAAAKRFVEGWLSYGERDGDWVKDQYLGQFSGAVADGSLVVGLRGAADKAAADAMMKRLREALAKLPPAVRERIAAEGSGDERGEPGGQQSAPPADEY